MKAHHDQKHASSDLAAASPACSTAWDEEMTMIFRVKDPRCSNRVKVGDKVEFSRI
jgi:hypothetical protein